MKILDTNSVNYILRSRLNIQDDYYLTDDIREEADIAESVIGRTLSSKIHLASNSQLFDEARYIYHYQEMLNKHRGRSFYNMSGFGDISILAFIKTIELAVVSQSQGRLFQVDDKMEIFTEDKPLIKKIHNESSKVTVRKNTDIK